MRMKGTTSFLIGDWRSFCVLTSGDRASLTLQVALALLGRLTYHVHILEMPLKTRPDHRAWPR